MNKQIKNSEVDMLLNKYQKHISKEGWIKSTICGLTIGFCIDIICSIIFLLFGIKLFWIGIITFAGGTAFATPIFYNFKFKKNKRQVAFRIDTLGLKERILTLVQFENDDSYIAQRQRKDAIDTLSKVNETLLKFAISVPMIIICSVCCVLSVGATTVSALSNQGIIDKIEETNDQYFSATYGVKNVEMGKVVGELVQQVIEGKFTDPVEAIANDDYVFVGWSDGYMDAVRSDIINKDGFEVYALFEPIEDNEEEDDITKEERDEGDPSKTGNGNPQPGASQDGSDGGNGESGDGAGGGSESASNQVVDGSTYYGDEYDSSLSDAQDKMNSGNNLSGNEKDMIGDYFHNIQK